MLCERSGKSDSLRRVVGTNIHTKKYIHSINTLYIMYMLYVHTLASLI